MRIWDRNALLASSAIICMVVATPALAQTRSFDVPAQSVQSAVNQLGQQADIQIVAARSVTRSARSNPVRGNMTVEQALEAMLAGTGLVARRTGAQTYTIVVAGQLRDVQAAGVADNGGGDEQEIVVTGTSIRGAGPTGAQMLEVSRETIADRGYNSLPDALRSLPQTATIGASPVLQISARQNGSVNYGRGSSVNLRGLGPDATLVLLNGRRLAPSGTGTFVDISQIPLAAVQRVEIVPDGSSAIYGSDAIGGVVNIITPRSIRGVALEASGTIADDYYAARASIATGFNWGSGGLTAAAEYRYSDLLLGSDRDFFGQNQTRFGGPDLRAATCAPGNVIAGGVTYALPPGNGVGLTPGALTPGTTNRCETLGNRSLYPRSNAWSGIVHAEQDLGSGLSLFADILYSRRKSYSVSTDPTTTLTVPNTNPYFIPFPGLTSVRVQYNFVNDLGVGANISRASGLTAVAGFNFDFAPNWRASAFYGYSRARDVSESVNDLNTFYINQALASSNPATAFNPFGSGGTSDPALIDTFRGYSIRPTRTEQQQLHAVIDGALGDPWGAGDVRVAIGGEWLDQDYLEINPRLTSTATQVFGPSTTGSRRSKAAFAELSLPVVGPAMGLGFLRSATLSAAIRHDDYSDFGATTNPRFGIDLEPFAGFHLRGTWGQSFKAPIIAQLTPPFFGVVYSIADPRSPTGTTTVLDISLGVRPLRPETAETWTLGLTYANADRTPLTVSATYFNIDYTDRIDLPSASVLLANEAFFPNSIIRNPTPAQIAAIQNDPNLSNSFTIPAGGIGAIVNSGYQNIASLRVRGIDLSAGYWWQTSLGRLSINGSLSRMLDYDVQSNPTLPTLAALGTFGFPNKWRAIGNAALENDLIGLFAGINLLGAYSNTSVNPAQAVPAYVTINAGIRFKLDRAFEWMPDDTSLQLSALNLFDRDPPIVLGANLGFDPFSHDPIGRQVTLALRTRF